MASDSLTKNLAFLAVLVLLSTGAWLLSDSSNGILSCEHRNSMAPPATFLADCVIGAPAALLVGAAGLTVLYVYGM